MHEAKGMYTIRKSKSHGKRILPILMVALMLASAIVPMTAAAESEENLAPVDLVALPVNDDAEPVPDDEDTLVPNDEPQSSDSDEIGDIDEEALDLEEALEVTEEEPRTLSEEELNTFGEGENDLELSAMFAKVTNNLQPVTGPISMTAVEAHLASGYQFKVHFDFPEGSVNKKLTLKVNPEARLVSVQGFQANDAGVTGTFSPDFGGIATYVDPSGTGWTPQPVSILDDSYNVPAGTLTYNFLDGADSGDLIFYVNMRANFLGQGPERVVNLVQATASCDSSDATSLSESVDLDFNITTFLLPGEGATLTSLDKEGASKTFNITQSVESHDNLYYKQLDYTFKIPSQIDLDITDIEINKGTLVSSEIVTLDTVKYLKISIKNLYGKFSLTGMKATANATAVPGLTYNLVRTQVDCISYDDISWTLTGERTTGSFQISDPTKPNKMSLSVWNYRWHPSSLDHDFNEVGLLRIENNANRDIVNQQFTMEFSQSEMAMKKILLTYAPAKKLNFANLVVTVDVDGTGTLEDFTCPAAEDVGYISIGSDANLLDAGLDPASFGANARIVRVDAQIPKIPQNSSNYNIRFYAGYRLATLTPANLNWGKITSNQIGQEPAGPLETVATGKLEITGTSTITGVQSSWMEYSSSHGHTNTTGYYPGDTFKAMFVGINFNGSSLANGTGYKDYCIADSYFLYLRTIPFTTIDTASVTSTRGSVTLVDDTLVDNEGNPVYKYLISDTVTNITDPVTLGRAPNTYVTFNISVEKGVATGDYNWSDWVFVVPTWSDAYKSNSLNSKLPTLENTASDVFGVTEGEYAGIYSIELPQAYKNLKLTASPEMTALAQSSIPSEGTWKNYNYKNESGQLTVTTTEGLSDYRLSVTNNTGDVATGGFVAYIPVPKEGENAGSLPASLTDYNTTAYIQPEAFGWSAGLTQEPAGSKTLTGGGESTPLPITVEYADEYSNLSDGTANWQSWSAFSNKDDIRMIRITSSESMPQGATFSFDFPLSLPEDAKEFDTKVNTWSAQLYLASGTGAGRSFSAPVSMKLQTGSIAGHVLLDTDGQMSAGAPALGGITVNAYERTEQGANGALSGTAISDTDGSFSFGDLTGVFNLEFVIPGAGTFTYSSDTFDYADARFSETESSDALNALDINSASHASSDDIVVYVQPAYTVSFDFNGATSTTTETAEQLQRYPAQTVGQTSVDAVRDTLTSPSEHNYFAGWNIDTQTLADTDYPYTVFGNVTLVAQWPPVDYTVTFAPGEHGAFSEKVHGGKHYEDATPAAPASKPGKPGWEFDDWDNPIADIVTETVTYTAMWNRIIYTVTYNGNGHTTGTEPAQATYHHGDAANVKDLNDLAKNGYTFVSWNTETDGTGISYVPGATISNITSNKTLYAQWTPAGGGGGDEDPPEPPDVRPPVIVDPPEITPPVVTPIPQGEVEVIPNPVEPEAPRVDVTPEEITFLSAAQDAGIPIGPGGVPLFGPKGFKAWSLVDLILMIVGVLLAIISVVWSRLRNRKDKDADFQEFEADEDEDRKRKARKRSLILLGILAVIGIILFVFTQDMTLPMVLIDGWTIIFAILAVIEVICAATSKKREHFEDETEGQEIA